MSKHGVYPEGNKFKVYVNNEIVYSARMQRNAEYMFERHLKMVGMNKPTKSLIETKTSKFHINQRFKFLNKAVKMVASGTQPSAVISGSGGLGKSYSVRKALIESGFRDMTNVTAAEGEVINRSNSFIVVKGFSTARGLFRTLYENNDSVIVYDDCDSILRDPTALNVLKGALDSYDTRIISWNSELRDSDLPRSFIFTGRVIFISNLPEEKIDQAIRSRSAVIDVSMTLPEIISRMEAMVQDTDFMPDYTMEVKTDSLKFIDEIKEKMREVNLRTLITVCKVRASDTDGGWKEMAEYLTCK